MFLDDFKYGFRLIMRNPGPSLLALAALGLGIGANTSIYSVSNGLLLHALPFQNLDRLVMVNASEPSNPASNDAVTPADFTDWRQQQQSFDAFSGRIYFSMNLSGSGLPENLRTARVSSNFFDTLGISRAQGRLFLPEEDQPGHDHEVILSQAVWKNHFAASPAMIGQTIELNGEAYTVLGVMGDDAVLPQAAQIWVPLALTPTERLDRKSHEMRVYARLRSGTSFDGATAEMQGIAQRLSATYPDTNKGWGVHISPMVEQVVGTQTRLYLDMLMGAVGFVLLIACANVSNLQFARAIGRQHELAIRTALGAGRWRLIRQMLAENILLALGGAAAGIAFAWWSLRLILVNMPPDVAVYIGGWHSIRLDARMLLFTLGVAIVAGVLSGILPAWSASRPNLNSGLKEGGRGSSSSRARRRLRGALVVLQVALALSLLVGAGLTVKGFSALQAADHDYKPDSLLTMNSTLPDLPAYRSLESRSGFYDKVMARLQAMPGVQASAVATMMPLSNDTDSGSITIDGLATTKGGAQPSAYLQTVSAGYFSALNLRMIEGRDFTSFDGISTPPVAIVSQALARKYWPHGGALGQRIKAGAENDDVPWLTVVGIAPDIRYDTGDHSAVPTLYRNVRQSAPYGAWIMLKSGGDVMQQSVAVRQVVAAIDPNQPLSQPKTLAEIIHEGNVGIAYVAVMMTVIGLIALCLSAVGVYAVMAHAVSERTHEIGLRMALGASTRQVATMIMQSGGWLLGIGMAMGLPLAFLLAHALSSLVQNVSPNDLETYTTTVLLLAGIAALACYLPARRAATVDPLDALREE